MVNTKQISNEQIMTVTQEVLREDISLWAGNYSPPPKKLKSKIPGGGFVKKIMNQKHQENKKKFKSIIQLFEVEGNLQKDAINLFETQNINENTLKWLLKWSTKNDVENSLQINEEDQQFMNKCIIILCHLAFPKEMIPGLRDQLFLRKVVERFLTLSKSMPILLSRHIQLSDLVMEEGSNQGAGGIVKKGTWFGIPVAVKFFINNGHWMVRKTEFYYEVALISLFGTFKHFIPCLGVNFEQGFFVMPLAQRGSLADLLENGQIEQLSWEKKTRMLYSIAYAIRSLHSNGILHRDLKPQNVIVDNNYNCYVTDFGISRSFSSRSQSRKRSLTKNIGTTSHMAPELFEGDGCYDFSVDVFSFGMLVWQIVSNSVNPYLNVVSSFDIPNFILSGKRLSVPCLCPEYLSSLIVSCWQQDPKKRPSIDAVLSTLNTFLTPEIPAHLSY